MTGLKQMSTWQETARQVQDYRDSSIAAVQPQIPDVPPDLPLNVTSVIKKLLPAKEVEITEKAPEDLVAAIASGALTSTEVTTAYLRRAGLAQKLVNCITELLPSRALERASYLDSYYSMHKKPIGPLHGLPVSVKEHISMKGLDLNAGFVSWVGHVGEEDALILRILWNAGCVFFARTTQPQTLMHLETSSNLYGETVNPFNLRLTSGGSSGGEGALVGLRGSCVGVGTDIGGSVRSPAANCGVYCLRPTSYRLPLSGIAATMLGQEQIVPVVGPLSTSLGGTKLFMKTVIDAQPWLFEPSLLPFPWRDKASWLKQDGNRKLKVAVLWDDGVVRPHPPVTRALREVTEKLKGIKGVEVVDWRPWRHDLAWKIISSLYFCDAGAEETEAINASGEPWRPLSSWIIRENPYVKYHTVVDVWQWTQKREQYRADYAKLWNETATGTDERGLPEGMVDVILCPIGPGAALPLNCTRYWGYTAQWNVLDYS